MRRVALLGALGMGLWAADPKLVWPGATLLGAPSHDGRRLSYVDPDTGDLGVRDLLTGETRLLTAPHARGEFAYFSAPSRDGRWIAYAWFNRERYYELRIVPAAGGKPRTLFRNQEAGFVQPCAWSPDGRTILALLFRKDNISQIALVPVDGGPVRVLRSLNWVYPKRMDLSPDGRFIVYDNFARDGKPERDVYLLATDGSRERPLIEHAANDLFPLWSADGAAVVFASDRDGSMDLWSQPVREGKADGPPRRIRRDLGRVLPLGLTQDGVYYYGLRAGGVDVYSAIEQGGKWKTEKIPSRFAGRNSEPEWSPDGKRLAYLSRRGSENYGRESRVLVVRDASGAEREYLPRMAHMERPRWSPDGKSILLSGSDGKGRAGLFRLDLTANAGAAPVTIEEDASYRGVPGAWVPGGSVIFAARGAIRGQDGGPLAEASGVTALAVSPDGRRIAYACADGIYEVGGGRIAAVAGVEGLRWPPAGLHYIRAGQVFRLSGEALPLPVEGEPAFHPAGAGLTFTNGRVRTEIWALPL